MPSYKTRRIKVNRSISAPAKDSFLSLEKDGVSKKKIIV